MTVATQTALQIFKFLYLGLVFISIVLSLTRPVDEAVFMFKFLMVAFGLLMSISLAGIIYYLTNTSFYPQEMEYKPWMGTYKGTGNYYFSTLVLCGTIMMASFVVPFLLRPLDVVENFMKYVVGLVSYLFMMPTFTNVMQIYAFCNLHDISWGNRPTTI